MSVATPDRVLTMKAMPSKRCGAPLVWGAIITILAAASSFGQTEDPEAAARAARAEEARARARARAEARARAAEEAAAKSEEQTELVARTAAGKIPDPSLFDGSGFDEEERPDYGLVSDFEVAGADPRQQQQAQANQQPPPPAGGQPQQQGPPQGGAPGGPQGGAGQPGQGGQQGQPGQPGTQQAPSVAAAADQQLVKPGEVQIGHQGAKLAESDVPKAAAGASLDNEKGEDRMQVKAAAGNQKANRDKGTERGVDIPSNL